MQQLQQLWQLCSIPKQAAHWQQQHQRQGHFAYYFQQVRSSCTVGAVVRAVEQLATVLAGLMLMSLCFALFCGRVAVKQQRLSQAADALKGSRCGNAAAGACDPPHSKRISLVGAYYSSMPTGSQDLGSTWGYMAA
jgi:hypothetical protein